jgi:hypothetical protein
MPPKGKWAQGIKPRHFCWIIQDQLAVSERPGGYGPNHRKVRRQEEIIWVREQGFAPVISIIPANHNLHNYDELGVPYRHYPFPPADDYPRYLLKLYRDIRAMLENGSKLLVHLEELGDRTVGLMAGYLVWVGMMDEPTRSIFLLEHMTSRQLGPAGRELVAVAAALPNDRDVS